MALAPQDRDDLRFAVGLLEKKRYIARLTHYAGQPIEQMMQALPQRAADRVHKLVRSTVTRLLAVALKTMGRDAGRQARRDGRLPAARRSGCPVQGRSRLYRPRPSCGDLWSTI